MSYYYIKVSGEAADAYLTVDLDSHRVEAVEGAISNDYRWIINPLHVRQFVVRHHLTNRYLEIPADGHANAIKTENNNTTLSFSISNDTTISNNVLGNPTFLVISANIAITTTDVTDADKFSITAAE